MSAEAHLPFEAKSARRSPVRRPASPAPGRPTAARRYDASKILRAAWKRYRFAYGNEDAFLPDLFAKTLKLEWAVARFAFEHGAEQARRDREAARRARTQPRRFMGRIVDGRRAAAG